ncbi:MAG: LPS export ABC transporter periplasmic protein LptC [Thauera sp.]|jgi:lipopolysaccharide export system protein LptC|nr:LPS export ABC transporter periplasmic protein LptC [Thauera sp.]
MSSQLGSFYRLYPLFALALLAAVSVWLERFTRVEDTVPSMQLHGGPDFTATETRIRGHDEDGRPSYELHARSLSHFPDRDVIVLEAPSLSLHKGERDTFITAARGEVLPGGEQVELIDEVRIRRPQTADSPALELDTAALTIWPDEQRAHSTQPVELRREHSRATALGMRADNLFGNFELIDQVRVHMPPRTPSRQGSAS